ncbi:S8 family serine peptidase [Akkermansiaceae bacterium]|nr:S8 family serine peptidase [Akkermansiaceae bacterium]
MKSRHLAFLSLLALSCASPGLAVPELGSSSDKPQQIFSFERSGVSYDLQLSSSETCTVDSYGTLKVQKTHESISQDSSHSTVNNFLVFYPIGEEGNPDHRQILRNDYLVELPVGTDPKEFQARHGIHKINMMFPEKGLAVCTEISAARVLSQVSAISKDESVKSVEPLFAKKRFSRRVPTDPYYSSPGENGAYQWYLDNDFNADGSLNNGDLDEDGNEKLAIDINVEGAWDLLVKQDENGNDTELPGNRVFIAIIDDGIFADHPDLTNVDLTISRNFNGGDTDDIDPQSIADNHGTSIAGLIASPWDNNEGITGVAPGSIPFGLRLTAGEVTDEEEADALFDEDNSAWVSNNSWGNSDLETTLTPIGQLAKTAIEEGAATGRVANAGTVYVWAGGNGGRFNDNSNYDAYANLPETIAVGAMNDDGFRPAYSEKGANLVVSAPSDGGRKAIAAPAIDLEVEIDEDGNITETIVADYDTNFGGTSAAGALVSGVVGLMIDANPSLPWRDIQEILMMTAKRNDPTNRDWYKNAAGFWFNHNYGAGLVDARAATQEAIDRTRPKRLPAKGLPLTLNQTPADPIPDGTGESYLLTFDLSAEPKRRVEHVQLRTTIISSRRADLEMVLISPSGTQSILAEPHPNSDEGSISDWTFMTVRNWGEGSKGKWILRVTDRNPGDQAFLNNAQIIVHGPEDEEAPVVLAPVLVSNRVIPGVAGAPLNYFVDTIGDTNITVGELPDGLVYNPGTRVISGAPVRAGLSDTELTISGPNGTSNVIISFVIEPIKSSLGSVVGVDSLDSTSAGSLPWSYDLNEKIEGPHSAGSPLNLGDNQESRFGFDNIPAGVAVFSWKVSSESIPLTNNYDRLWVQLKGGNVPQNWSSFIDGEKDWSQVALRLPQGSNKIEWIYSKDNGDNESGDVVQDRGFVDALSFKPYSSFLKDIEDSANINFDFDIESRTLWIPVADDTASDGQAIRASGVGNGQTVSLSTWVDGPASLSLDYKTSTLDGDVLEVLVNGVVYNQLLTTPLVGFGIQTNQWQTASGDIPEGRNFVEFRFRKDLTGTDGEDTVWLDNVSITFPSTAASWLGENGIAIGDLDGDSDRDGFSNREERAFGGNPNLVDVPALAPAYQTDGISRWFEYGIDSAITDLSYEIQESVDLINWAETNFTSLNRTEGSVSYYRIPVFEQGGEPDKYYRLIATEIP